MLMPPSPYSSSDYWQLIRDGNPTHVKLEFSNSGGTLTDSDISSMGGLTVTSIVNPEPNMKYGTVSSTEVRVVLIDNPNLANISWENEFELSMGVEDNGTTVWVSLGNFKGKAPEKSAYTTTPSDIVFTAYDIIRNLANIPADDLISLVTFPTTFKNMCDTIFAGAGYTIQFVDNYNQTVEKNPFPAGLNLRQVAEKIAEATYCFVKADPLGYTDLLFTPYANKTRHHLTVDDYYDVNISNIIPIAPGTYKWTNTDKPSLSLTYQYPNGTSLSEIYEVIDNNIVSSIAYADRQSFMDTIVYGHIFPIYLVLTPSTPDIIQYRIASVNCVGNWLIEAGDAVKVDYPDNNTTVDIDMLVFSRTLFWNGSCVDTYECTGSTSRSDDIMADSSSTLAEKLSYKADYDKVVHIDGSEQTIDGHKTFTYRPEIANDVSDPNLYFSSSQDIGSWNGRLIFNDARVNGHVGNGYFSFIAYSPDNNGHMTNYYEEFCFPSVDTGRSTNATYKIITTKDGLANNLTTTTEGYALDARQGKMLKDSIPTKVSQLTNDSGFTTNTGTVTSVATGAGLTGGTIISSGTISINGMNTSTGDTTKCLTQKGTWASFTNNAGTVTSVKMNGTAYNPSSGVVDLGTVITSHQDISGKVNKSGDTMTGNLTVQMASGDTGYIAKRISTGLQVYLIIGSGDTNHGVYSNGYVDSGGTFHSDAKWILYRDASNVVRVNGNCTGTATNVTGTVAVANGGTGATTAANARKNIGTTVYSELVNPDYNTVFEAGLYGIQGGSPTHYPSGATNKFGTLLVMEYRRSSNNYYTQVLFTHDNPNRIYIRTSDANATTWRDWTEITGKVSKSGDTMTGALTATNFTSTNYNLESVGARRKQYDLTANTTKTFTVSNGFKALMTIASGTFASNAVCLIVTNASGGTSSHDIYKQSGVTIDVATTNKLKIKATGTSKATFEIYDGSIT